MIRINLIGERPRGKVAIAVDLGQKVTILCSFLLLLTGLLIGWWYWSLRQDTQRLDEEIVAAQRETERLRSILVQVEQFEQRRAQLEQRVVLIEQLRQGQGEPVRMLDQISLNLPERLWLTALQQEGSDVTLEGRTVTLVALSDFVANLEGSGYFRRPVEILDSQLEPSPEGDLIRFSVKAQFATPEM